MLVFIGLKQLIFFFHLTMEIMFTLPRPLHSDRLCATLLLATFGVTVTLFIDKTNVREVVLFY